MIPCLDCFEPTESYFAIQYQGQTQGTGAICPECVEQRKDEVLSTAPDHPARFIEYQAVECFGVES